MVVGSSPTYISHLVNGLFKQSCEMTFFSSKENTGHVPSYSEQTILLEDYVIIYEGKVPGPMYQYIEIMTFGVLSSTTSSP